MLVIGQVAGVFLVGIPGRDVQSRKHRRVRTLVTILAVCDARSFAWSGDIHVPSKRTPANAFGSEDPNEPNIPTSATQ